MTDQQIAEPHPVEGGVTSARGFRATGVHAGFRKDPERRDLALVVADEPCACAAVFTQNVFCSAPVTVSREHLEGVGYGTARAVVVNSGNANAATGEPGLEAARETARIAGDAVGCPASEVLVASTGVIGVQLPLAPFGTGLPAAVSLLSAAGGADAARAIMTTDTCPKEAAATFSGDGVGYDGCTFTVGGMAKGSGMIMPNMATMISVLTTDAPVAPNVLHEALVRAVGRSFNKVTVDSDTSTNDSCFLFASGDAAPAGAGAFDPDGPAFARFEAALTSVCETLARMMAADGEGASLASRHRAPDGAANDADADLAARAVAELAAREDGHLRPRRELGTHRHGHRQVGSVVQAGRRVHRHHGPARVPRRARASVRRGRGAAPFRAARDRHRRRPRRRRGGNHGLDVRFHARIHHDQRRLSLMKYAKDTRPKGVSHKAAEVLVEALPWIKNITGKTVVIKYGGSAMVDAQLRADVMNDIVLLKIVGVNPVIVHGGGKAITEAMELMQFPVEFKDGQRVTTPEAMDLVRTVLMGKVNQELVEALNEHGNFAVGVSGADAGVIVAEQASPDLGRVGRITRINSPLLDDLVAGDYIPVVASVALGEDGGFYNVNADMVAGHIAAAIGAHKVVFLTDVDGLYENFENKDSLISNLTLFEAQYMVENNIVSTGMIPKLKSCIHALDSGVFRAHIINGITPHSLLLELLTSTGVGFTMPRRRGPARSTRTRWGNFASSCWRTASTPRSATPNTKGY